VNFFLPDFNRKPLVGSRGKLLARSVGLHDQLIGIVNFDGS